MERILIEATSHSPEVDFDVNGKLRMEGRSIPENISNLFDPLINFVSKLTVDKVVFDINLDYFNTATSKKLLELMKHIEANNKIGEVLINWHFEEGDDDSQEMAEIYEECLRRTKFRYHEYAEAA
jgi:hypothetical protein